MRHRSPSRHAYPLAITILMAASLAGIGISLWAHVESLGGRDPNSLVKKFWLLQLILFALLLPIIVELFSRRNHVDLFHSPRWMRNVLYFLLAYYGLNFYVFLYWSVDDLTSAATWRMFSAGWILLFALAAVYYHVRWQGLRKNRRLPLETTVADLFLADPSSQQSSSSATTVSKLGS